MIIVCALPFEARPFIDFFKLKLVLQTPFAIYENSRIKLIVSGVGSLSVVSAISFIQALEKDRTTTWLNVGIAASASFSIGDLIMPSSVEMNTLSPIYPSYPFKPLFPLAPLRCFSSPQQDLEKGVVVDMESYGFFYASSKFAPLESIISVKCISDHGVSHFSQIDKHKVQLFLQQAIGKLEPVFDLLLSQEDHLNEERHPLYDIFTSQKHFSVTEKHELLNLLHQSKVMNVDTNVIHQLFHTSTTGSLFLAHLNSLVNSKEMEL